MSTIGTVCYGKRKNYGSCELQFLNNDKKTLGVYRPDNNLAYVTPADRDMPAVIAGPHFAGRVSFFDKGTPQDSRPHDISQFILFENIHEYQKWSVSGMMETVIPQHVTEDDILNGYDRRDTLREKAEFPFTPIKDRCKGILFRLISAAASGRKVLLETDEPGFWHLVILQCLSARFICAMNVKFTRGQKIPVNIAVNCEGFPADEIIRDEEFSEKTEYPAPFESIQSLSEFLYYAVDGDMASPEKFQKMIEKYIRLEKFKQYGLEPLLAEHTITNAMLAKKQFYFNYLKKLRPEEEQEAFLGTGKDLILQELGKTLGAPILKSDAEYLLCVLLSVFKEFRYQKEVIEGPITEIRWKELWKFVDSSSAKYAKKNRKILLETCTDLISKGGAEWFSY